MQRDHSLAVFACAGFILTGPPVAALWYLLSHPEADLRLEEPVGHFYVVTAIALCAAMFSALVAATASRLQDIRATIMALGFFSLAGFFTVHALTTPGVLVGPNSWVGISAKLGLWIVSACIALSSLALGRRLDDRFRRRAQVAVGCAVLGLAVYGAAALNTSPSLVPTEPTAHAAHDHSGYDYAPPPAEAAQPEPRAFAVTSLAQGFDADQRLNLVLSGASLALLGLALARYWRGFRLSGSASQAAVAIGVVLLAQAQVSTLVGEVWRVSWWLYHALLLLSFLVMMSPVALNWARGRSLTDAVQQLLVEGLVGELARSRTEATRALIAALEAKDAYTRGHSDRVAVLAAHIGQAMGLAPSRLRVISQAGLLHDIGKLGVPDAVLNKPGPLSPEEFAHIREHPGRGGDLLQALPALAEEARIVRHHHERLDGNGYPDRLSGEQIPLEARIVTVADVFDALTSDRAYRSAWSQDETVQYLRAHAGTHFDPACVDALLKVVGAEHQAASRRVLALAQPR